MDKEEYCFILLPTPLLSVPHSHHILRMCRDAERNVFWRGQRDGLSPDFRPLFLVSAWMDAKIRTWTQLDERMGGEKRIKFHKYEEIGKKIKRETKWWMI